MDFRAFVESLQNNGRNGSLFIFAIGGFFGLVLFWQVALCVIAAIIAVWCISVLIAGMIERAKRRRARRRGPSHPSDPVMIFKIRNFK